MEMDEADPRPMYQRIADDLRKAIADGTYPPGNQLPTLAELTKTYGAAVMTVRDALRQLATDGLIVSRQGKGAYVLRQPAADEHPSVSQVLELFQQISRSVDDLNDRMTVVEKKLAGRRRSADARQPPSGD
jgi:DNA-binding GntR family transcriptional regulator